MSKTPNETGHYKNVANFKKLCSHLQSLPEYNPPRDALKPVQMLAQHDAAEQMMTSLHTATTAEKTAAKARAVRFTKLPRFTTRLLAEFEAAVPDAIGLAQARHHLAKIQGVRIGKKPKNAEAKPATETPVAATGEGTPAETQTPKSNSASQRSFDAVLDHFDKLLTVIEGEPGYQSARAEMQPIGLRTFWETAKQTNRTAVDANVVATRMRNLRNELLYKEVTGVIAVALAAKKSVLSVYEATSPEYKQVRGIRFRDLSHQ